MAAEPLSLLYTLSLPPGHWQSYLPSPKPAPQCLTCPRTMALPWFLLPNLPLCPQSGTRVSPTQRTCPSPSQSPGPVPVQLYQDLPTWAVPCLHTAGHRSPQVPQVRQEHSSDRQCCALLPDQFRVPLRAERQAAPAGHPGGAERHGILPGGDGEPPARYGLARSGPATLFLPPMPQPRQTARRSLRVPCLLSPSLIWHGVPRPTPPFHSIAPRLWGPITQPH